jgi:hypothetical protein
LDADALDDRVCDDLFDSKRRMVLSLFCLGAEVTLLLHVRVPATIFFAEDTDERRCLNAKNVFRLSICLIPVSPDFLSRSCILRSSFTVADSSTNPVRYDDNDQDITDHTGGWSFSLSLSSVLA